MKKGFNLFILGLIMFLGCLVDVNAKSAAFENQEIFIHDWKTDNEVESIINIMFSDSVGYYDYGYISSKLNIDFESEVFSSKLVKYDVLGNILKEKVFKDTLLIDYVIIDNIIYTLSLENSALTDEGVLCITIYDLDFKILNQYIIGNEEIFFDIFENILLFKQLNLDIFSTDNDGNGYLVVPGFPFVFAFGPDYDDLEMLEGSNYVYKYFPYYDILEHKNEYNYIGYDIKDNVEVLSGGSACSSLEIPTADPKGISDVVAGCDSFGVISLYIDNEEIWTNLYHEYTDIINPRIVDNYIVAIGTLESYSEIIILNMDGEIVQKIDLSDGYYYLESGEKSFIVISLDETASNNCPMPMPASVVDGLDIANVGGSTTLPCFTVKNEVWYIPLTIETKTDGNGNVTAVPSSRYGEDVSFTVTPKEGFVLGEVKVTDEFGNVVIFNDYHFTMPNANVVIDVTFLPKNSETADIAIVALVVIALGTGIVLLKNRKRLN